MENSCQWIIKSVQYMVRDRSNTWSDWRDWEATPRLLAKSLKIEPSNYETITIKDLRNKLTHECQITLEGSLVFAFEGFGLALSVILLGNPRTTVCVASTKRVPFGLVMKNWNYYHHSSENV